VISAKEAIHGEDLGAHQNIKSALETLSQMEAGRPLVQKAQSVWGALTVQALAQHFQWGEVSRTDSVITRHYDSSSGTEKRQRDTVILLRRDQPSTELLLDMAHEMVHATAQPTFDPYDPTLSSGRYIRAALEGEGGEVNAVVKECEVALEITAHTGEVIDRCKGYYGGDGRRVLNGVDRERILHDFYKVGHWKKGLMQKLGRDSTVSLLLTEETPAFYSSTGRSPYPVALFEEFVELTRTACDNTFKRTIAASRQSAMEVRYPVKEEQRSREQFVRLRCGGGG
jgi:hypothetical protein